MRQVRTAGDAYDGIVIAGANGSYCWAADGRRYLDLVCGQGAIILGHCDPTFSEALHEQIDRGTLFPGRPEGFEHLRALLCAIYQHSSDMLTFKSGSEAVAAALRLSRAFTGRTKVIRIGFSGWHDQVASPYVRCHSYDVRTFEYSLPSGVPHAQMSELADVWFGDDLLGLPTTIDGLNVPIAAIIIDPVQIGPSAWSSVGYVLAALRERGVCVIFDESKTGFRVGMSGAQGIWNVAPDITILSKALGNGLPLAVVLGSSDMIGLAGECQIKGTFALEALSIAAAIKCVTLCMERDVPATVNAAGRSLLSAFASAIDDLGLHNEVEPVPYHWPSMPYLRIIASGETRALSEMALYRNLRRRGVLMLDNHMSYVPATLGSVDVDFAATALSDSLRAAYQV